MRAFINCSEPVLDSSHRAFLERFAPLGLSPDQLGVSYAMAENVFAVTQTPPGRAPRVDTIDREAMSRDGRAIPAAAGTPEAAVFVSCGPPVPGVRVRVDGGRPDRVLGELEVSSHCLMTGYHRRPELDVEAFRDGWYRTGDLGYVADGEVFVVGRKKDLIISGGRNIHPHDLEVVVSEVPGVHPGRVVAFGVTDEREGTELITVLAEADAEDPERRQAIASAIRRALISQSGVAATYVGVVPPRWLVKTSSGKIAREANRRKWLAERTTA
jgi:acyl-CoA synthetase (AMP-forming)/AMP-acid ligase II